MTRDATLDQFEGRDGGDGDRGGEGGDDGGGGRSADAGDADEAVVGDGTDPGTTADDAIDARAAGGDGARDGGAGGDAEPAVSTYRFAPDGAACATCGEGGRRLWRDGADLVCADCKVWSGE